MNITIEQLQARETVPPVTARGDARGDHERQPEESRTESQEHTPHGAAPTNAVKQT